MLHQRIITWVVLGAVALAPLAGVVAQQQPATTPSREEFREEFHQSYPLSPTGRVSLENINGSVRITGWERNEVKLDAVKRSHTRERLAEAEIRVETTADALRIKTRYPERSFIQDGNGRRYEDPASVDYTLTVPRGARLEGIALINGSLDIEGVNGDVHGSSINGRVTARGLTARTKLSTVNGTTEAVFTQLGEPGVVELSSVNGAVQVTIPSDANAEVKANTVHGQITNDFGLPVRRGRFVGRDLAGVLGRGGTLLRLSNVNGTVRITRANDGKQQSTVRNLLSEARADDEDEPEGPDEVEIGPGEVSAEVNREVAREVAKAQREAERE
ncbi:MAG TPA: hypothetical protein VEQ42_11165, partial [Pyrinomonadaceae bacterium]|nr:hypothetical protein [Pyrinomonadaceae bacterium]